MRQIHHENIEEKVFYECRVSKDQGIIVNVQVFLCQIVSKLRPASHFLLRNLFRICGGQVTLALVTLAW